MAKIPEYDHFTQEEQQLPGVRQDVPRHLLGLAELGPGEQVKFGQQMQQFGATIGQIQNEAKGKTYAANLVGAHQAILTGSPGDPNNGVAPTQGYLDLKGQAAVDAYQGTIDALKKAQSDESDKLDNDIQRNMVSNYGQIHTQSAIGQATQHYQQQLQVANQAAAATQLKVNGDAAIKSFNPITDMPTLNFDHDNPQSNSPYQLYLQSAVSAVKDLADQQGLVISKDQNGVADQKSVAARADFIRQQLGGIYTGAITHLIENNQTPAAQQYFSAVKNQLDAHVADSLQDKLKTASNVDKMYQYTDGLFQNHPDEASQLKQVATDFQDGRITGEQRKLIESRISQAASEQRSAQSEQAANVLGNVADYVQKNQNASILDFAKSFPSQYQVLQKSGHLETAVKYFNEGGSNKKGDPALYNSLLDMAVDNPKALLDYPTDKMMAQLSIPQFNQVMASRRAINKQDVQQLQTDKLVTNTVRDTSKQLAAAGINLNPKSDSDKQKLDMFMAGLRTSLYMAAQNNGGVPLTDKQAHDIALASVKDQAIAGTGIFGLFQTHKPVYQMTPTEKADNWQIPSDTRSQIVAALKAKGKPTDEATVQAVYKNLRGQ